MFKKLNRGISTLVSIGIIAVLVVVVGGGVFLFVGTFNSVQPETNISDETAGWQTYRNEQHGFEIKYPGDWYYSDNDYENQQVICFNPKGLTGDCAAILTISWNIELQERYVGMKQLFEKDYTVAESVISVAGAEGKLLTIGNTPGFTKSLFWEKNNYIYNFAMREIGYETLFNQILSTFRLIKQGETSTFNENNLLRKLFPNLSFKNGLADLASAGDTVYDNYPGLKLYLKNSVEDYFINNQKKSLLLIAQLDGVAHAGGLFHAYLGLFDKKSSANI